MSGRANALYDRIGQNYAAIRRPDPRLAEPTWQVLGDARTLVNRRAHDELQHLYGPRLQVAVFDRNESPPEAEVEAVAHTFRSWFELL